MTYGFSLSKNQCEWLGVNWKTILDKLAGSSFGVVRLGLYWDEIEKEADKYDFSSTEEMLKYAIDLGYEVILTVGVKAPRWPEFYFPDHIEQQTTQEFFTQQHTLKFVTESARHFKSYKIQSWQVENEPLDPSGPNGGTVDWNLLQREIDAVKTINSTANILVTAWGNDLRRRDTLSKILKLRNISEIGFDFYPKQPSPYGLRGPDSSKKDLIKLNEDLKAKGIKPIIAELQAEPWEEDFDYRESPEKIESISLEQIQKNIADYKDLGFEEIILWGAEYWEWAGILEDVVKVLL